jgi:FkbM family methyltransferase
MYRCVGRYTPRMPLFKLTDFLGKKAPMIDIVDVGAMWLQGEDREYARLLKAGVARVVGFEPVQAECDKLNKMGLRNAKFLPYFIGDGTERTFHLTNQSMTSSLYEPQVEILKRFSMLLEQTTVVETSKVQTKRLDEIPEVTGCHFLKIDVQGAELDCFRGGEKLVENALVIQAEANFVPFYRGQPLFSDIDVYLRSKGYFLHAMYGPVGRSFNPVVVNNNPYESIRQVLWADFVYIKDFLKFGELPSDDLLRIALLAHDVFGSYDLAALALQHLELRDNKGLWQAYMSRLLGTPNVPAPPPIT